MDKKKGFASIFFTSDENTKKEEVKKPSASPTSSAAPTMTNMIGMSGVVDSKFVEMLQKVIDVNNIPGLDYYEFKKAIEAMSNIPLDETNKFLTTYAIYSGQGCTKEILLSSLDKYIAIIQKEDVNFDNELKKQYQIKVQAKIDAVEKAKVQLEELNKQIIETNAFVLKTTQEVQQEQSNLQNTEANFKKSLGVVLNGLLSDKEKITNIIK